MNLTDITWAFLQSLTQPVTDPETVDAICP